MKFIYFIITFTFAWGAAFEQECDDIRLQIVELLSRHPKKINDLWCLADLYRAVSCRKESLYWFTQGVEQFCQMRVPIYDYSGEVFESPTPNSVYGFRNFMEKQNKLLENLLEQEDGSPFSQLMLGQFYYDMFNFKEAFMWYSRAAEQGLAEAQFRLGWHYESGLGVDFIYKGPSNNKEAYEEAKEQFRLFKQNETFRLYKLCSDQGNINGLKRLAGCYFDGLGVKQNYQTAFKYYLRAAQKGDKDAAKVISWMGEHDLCRKRKAIKELPCVKKEPVMELIPCFNDNFPQLWYCAEVLEWWEENKSSYQSPSDILKVRRHFSHVECRYGVLKGAGYDVLTDGPVLIFSNISFRGGLNNEMICGLLESNWLTSINLSGNFMVDATIDAMAPSLQKNSSLTSLILFCNSIGNLGVSTLATALQSNRTLVSLNLSSNEIGDVGAMSLVSLLRRNQTIKLLDLSNNQIGEEAGLSLASLRLDCLNLKNNKTQHYSEISMRQCYGSALLI